MRPHIRKGRGLVLINAFAHYIREHDYPWGLQRDMLVQYEEAARSGWGTGAGFDLLCPSKAGDRAFRERWARAERLGIGVDDGATALLATFEQDARALLRAGIRQSRVVLELTPGNVVTAPRSDMMFAVTEFGMVCLKGKSIPERARAMISIAHPDFREDLERDARKSGLIPRSFR